MPKKPKPAYGRTPETPRDKHRMDRKRELVTEHMRKLGRMRHGKR